MKKIGNWYFYRNNTICKNYGGWVIAENWCWDIFKTLSDAQAAVDKMIDGRNKKEPKIIGRMTEEQFINSLV